MPKLYSKPSGMQSEEGASTMLVRKRSVNHNNKTTTTTTTTNNNNSNGATDTLPLYEKQESSSSSDLTSTTVDTSLSSSSSSSDFATNIVKSFQNKNNKNNKQDESSSPTSAILLLNLVAIIWGSQHSIIKMVVDDSPAAAFTLLRFAIGALIASPYTPGWSSMSSSSKLSNNNDNEQQQQQVAKAWRWGLEMGVWMFAGFALQAVGLESTTAQRSGFLIYLNVKFVPFFARVLFGKPISIPTWVSAFVAFVGTALLACDGGGGQQQAAAATVGLILNVGDLWTIVAAASSAMFILRLEEATLQVEDSASLNAATLWTVFGLSVLWTFFFGSGTTTIVETVTELGRIAYAHPLELIYLGGVTTALSNFIQTKAQKNVSAERACLIYSLDPVYGAVFSYWLLGEQLGGPQAYVGAGMITLAAATNAFLDFGKTTTKKNDDDDDDDDGDDNELV